MKTSHIESAYGNAMVALETQLCIPHLTVMTSPEIRHYEIKYLWIHQVGLSKKFILYFSTLFFFCFCSSFTVASTEGLQQQGRDLDMLERLLNVIACTVLTKPHHLAISDMILEKSDPNYTSSNIELTPSQCMATLLAILFLILKLLKALCP